MAVFQVYPERRRRRRLWIIILSTSLLFVVLVSQLESSASGQSGITSRIKRRRNQLNQEQQWQIVKTMLELNRMSDGVNWEGIRQKYGAYIEMIRSNDHRKRTRRRSLSLKGEGRFAIAGRSTQERQDEDDNLVGLDDDAALVDVPTAAPSQGSGAGTDAPTVVGGGGGTESPTVVSAGEDTIAPTAGGGGGANDDLVGLDDDLPPEGDVPSAAPTPSDGGAATAAPTVAGETFAPTSAGETSVPTSAGETSAPTAEGVGGTDDDAVGVDDDLPPEDVPTAAPTPGDGVGTAAPTAEGQGTSAPSSGGGGGTDDAIGVDDDLPPEGVPTAAPTAGGQGTSAPSSGGGGTDDAVGVDDDIPPEDVPTAAPTGSNNITIAPSLAPSVANQTNLTLAPSLPPSMFNLTNMTAAPSAAPSLNETKTPSIAPSLSAPTTPRPTPQPFSIMIPTRPPTPDPTPQSSPEPSPEPMPEPSSSPKPLPPPTPSPTPSKPSTDYVDIPIYEYDRGNCPDAGSTGLPCAPESLARACSKYDGGSFSECLRICEPSFCCIHDAPGETNPVAPNCNQDENCAQYAPCYIVWWKIHDTVGPAVFLMLQQTDDFFDIDQLQDVTTNKNFYSQWAYHHWDDIGVLLTDLLDDMDGLEGLFSSQAIWEPG